MRRTPTIFIASATVSAIISMNATRAQPAGSPSAWAMSSATVAAKSGRHRRTRVARIAAAVSQMRTRSLTETARMSPNR